MYTEFWTSDMETTKSPGATSLPEFHSAELGHCEDSTFYPIDTVEMCSGESCSGYEGKQMYTKNGRLCQPWDVNSPHLIDQNLINSLNVRNYCRNSMIDEATIWCYTMDPNT